MGCGSSREVEHPQHAAQVEEVCELLRPHAIARRPLPPDLGALLDVLVAEDPAVLTEAADKVVAELLSLSRSTSKKTAAAIDGAMRAARLAAHHPTELTPLHARLKCVNQILQLYVHTTLSSCTLPMVDEADVLLALWELVVQPAVVNIKEEMVAMCADVRERPALYREQVARLGNDDTQMYSLVFKKLQGSNAPAAEQDAFASMLESIKALEAIANGAAPDVQRVANLLELTVEVRKAVPTFQRVIGKVESVLQAFGVAGITVQHRAGTKALYRMIEKAVLKGPEKDPKRALETDTPLDCSKLLDVVGCLFLCDDFKTMKQVIDQLRAVIEQADDVEITRTKNRWLHATAGGWADLMVNLSIRGIIFEIQVAHKKMMLARKDLGGHASYNDFRSYAELLSFTGAGSKHDRTKEVATVEGAAGGGRGAAAGHGGATAVSTTKLAKAWASLVTDYFPPLQNGYSTVVLSYQTHALGTDLGKLFMWAVANALKKANVTSFNGYQVTGGDSWQEQWFGVLPGCQVVVAMLSKSYLKSQACIDEIKEAVSLKKPIIPVYLEEVDISGDFLGTDFESKKTANFIRKGLSGNRIPPPDQGFFQGNSADDFNRNMATLVKLIKQKYSK
jgi:hypothetical protein